MAQTVKLLQEKGLIESSVNLGRVRPGGAPCFCFALFSLVPQFFFRCPQTVSAGDHLGHPERKPRPVDAHGADEQPQAGQASSSFFVFGSECIIPSSFLNCKRNRT